MCSFAIVVGGVLVGPFLPGSGLGEPLPLASESLDLDLTDVAGAEVREATGEGDPFGGSPQDQVARVELEVLAEVPDEERHVEDHVSRRGVLPWMPLTQLRKRSELRSSSSGVTNHGPVGVKEGELFPFDHCPPDWTRWKSRSEMSFIATKPAMY